ncbi:hypothetical protein PULV_b0437 [Pseudoalteromonas ulvae UL12]|nr:hypothetical protein [Pseudoalteromonas ulvae UL12]
MSYESTQGLDYSDADHFPKTRTLPFNLGVYTMQFYLNMK